VAVAVSIAVMNWVWANSPTSGNERLVLLALADACSRDDGTGCWPSAATIARKANISDRTVRRVVARLEADGHLVVHRGGGRCGSTNSYTVVTGDRVIHSPGQNDAPDNLSGGDTGDIPPRTQPCQGTPVTAASADPPGNRKGTAPARAIGEFRPPDKVEAAGVGAFYSAMARRSERWLLTAAQRRKLAPAIAAAFAAGWTPEGLAEFAGASTTGIRNPFAVLAARLSPGELPPSIRPRPARPPWCGMCDERTRMLGFDGDAPSPCPRCKPIVSASRADATTKARVFRPYDAHFLGRDARSETRTHGGPRGPRGRARIRDTSHSLDR